MRTKWQECVLIGQVPPQKFGWRRGQLEEMRDYKRRRRSIGRGFRNFERKARRKRDWGEL